MANIYKVFRAEDVQTVRQPIYEQIPISGSIVYGTYGTEPDPTNVKKYSHGMWQTVYDYPYLSSSANPMFDLTIGLNTDSTSYANVTSQQDKKRNVYNTFAQRLAGYDENGEILAFDQDGDFTTGSDKYNEILVMNFGRLLYKDEIRKGTFQLELDVGSDPTAGPDIATVYDASGSTEYKVNSQAGEYGILYLSGSASNIDVQGAAVGLIYYQAGAVVLSSELFMDSSSTSGSLLTPMGFEHTTGDTTWLSAIETEDVDAVCDGFRERIKDISFQNTTEINSSLYFCDMGAADFNYSSNPTYLSGSKIQVKRTTRDAPVTYVTTVGLYGADNTLLAVAKLSEPIKKTPSNSQKIRVRLDY